MPRGQQGASKATASGGLIEVGNHPTPPDPHARLIARIMDLIARGKRWGYEDAGRPDPEHQWWIWPGVCPWWEARQGIGGRTPSERFRRAVDDLLTEGRLIEVWLVQRDDRTAPHLLMIPGHSAALRRPVARARGNPKAIRREPWGPALLAAARAARPDVGATGDR